MEQSEFKLTSKEFTALIENLSQEPLIANIFFFVLRHPKITAKEIKKNYSLLKGTSIYYYLRQLTEKKLLVTETIPVENKNLLQKQYSINYQLFSRENLPATHPGKDRNIALFHLFVVQNVINNKIKELVSLSQREFEDIASQSAPDLITSYSLASTMVSPELREKFEEINKLLLKESKKQLGETLIERLNGKSLIFMGNFELKD